MYINGECIYAFSENIVYQFELTTNLEALENCRKDLTVDDSNDEIIMAHINPEDSDGINILTKNGRIVMYNKKMQKKRTDIELNLLLLSEKSNIKLDKSHIKVINFLALTA